MADYKLKCKDCGYEFNENKYYINCPKCEGFLGVKLISGQKKGIDNKYKSIFKYHRYLPILDEDVEKFKDKEFYEDTPIVYAKNLSKELGIQLFFKDETIMETGTWKDREGFISIYRLVKNNIPDLVVFSSGNTGTSIARSASLFKGPRIHLVLPKASKGRISNLTKFFDPNYVKVQYFEGSNDECIEEAKKIAKEKNILAEGGFANYARREGLKLLALEYIFNWDQEVDWYVQAVAGGIGIYSFYKAHKEAGSKCPKMLAAQPEACSPMVNAWKDKSSVLKDKHIPKEVIPSNYVRVLRTRNPGRGYSILKEIMDEVGGAFESVSDKKIHSALRMFYLDDYYKNLKKEKNITVGVEPATALAAIVKSVKNGLIKQGERVLLNVSGAAKGGDVKEEWIADLLI